MDTITQLIREATAARAAATDKQQAFDRIVRRFQDLAFACAYSVLGDFGLAEDAAQDAFLTAWRHLDQLRAPEAFPGWLKRIVLTQCRRQTRGKRLDTVPPDSLRDLPSPKDGPYQTLARRETQDEVKVKQDRNIIAVLLFGSLSYDQSIRHGHRPHEARYE